MVSSLYKVLTQTENNTFSGQLQLAKYENVGVDRMKKKKKLS